VTETRSPLRIGRYALHDEIAAGGMATVHLGRLLGNAGFTRLVAIKRLHAELARDPEFSAMFLDEARMAARISHPHVVDVLDVVADAAGSGELFLVMPYVHGDSLAHLLVRARADGRPVPLDVAATIMVGVLQGLHAAHEARSERGAPLHLVHRDVSPQNVLVGADGVARVIDFGVAKAVGRARVTRDATVRGKIAYMAPEQLQGEDVDRRSDVYAAGVVLWELLTGQPLFAADSDAATLTRALHHRTKPPSTVDARVPASLDEVVLRATERTRSRRFGTAREMATAIERAIPPASTARVAEWVDELASDVLAARAAAIVRIEGLREEPDAHADTAPAAPPLMSGAVASSSSDRTWSQRALGVALIAACLTGGVAFAKFRPGASTVASVPASVAAPPLVASASGPAPERTASAPRASADIPVPSTAEAPASPDAAAVAHPQKPARASFARERTGADPAAYQ
jgi:serine/threonine-protein kinase